MILLEFLVAASKARGALEKCELCTDWAWGSLLVTDKCSRNWPSGIPKELLKTSELWTFQKLIHWLSLRSEISVIRMILLYLIWNFCLKQWEFYKLKHSLNYVVFPALEAKMGLDKMIVHTSILCIVTVSFFLIFWRGQEAIEISYQNSQISAA